MILAFYTFLAFFFFFFFLYHQKEKYAGDRSLDDLKQFVVKQLGDEAGAPEQADEPQPPVAVLTSENFENAIGQGYTLVKFFAPWYVPFCFQSLCIFFPFASL